MSGRLAAMPGLGAGVALLGASGALDLMAHLAAAGVPVLDAEPPPDATSPELAARHGFRRLSARTGEVTTPGALAVVLRAALDGTPPEGWIWRRADGRLVDGLRAGVDPDGIGDEPELTALRLAHGVALIDMLRQAGSVILAFGGTEDARADGAVFPALPPATVSLPKGQKLTLQVADLATLEADFDALSQVLSQINPALERRLMLLPLADAGGDFTARLPVLRQQSDLRVMMARWAATRPAVRYLPVWEMCTGPLAEAGQYVPASGTLTAEGGAAVAALCLGRALPVAEAGPAAPAAEADDMKSARRAQRRANRAAKGKAVASVVCEDELLEAFSK